MTLNRLNCRRAAHDAERHAQLIERGNPFALTAVGESIETATRAYLSEACEPATAMRLHAAIDRIGGAAQ